MKIWLFEEVLVWFHKISAGNSGNTFWPPGLLIGIYGAVTANIIQEKIVKSKNDIHSFISEWGEIISEVAKTVYNGSLK